MRTTMTTIVLGLALAACAPAEEELELTETGLFEADTDAAVKPMDDLGFEAARLSVTTAEKMPADMMRELEDDLDEDPDCSRVAYLGAVWTDTTHKFRGTIYTLDGRAVAKTRGYHAPVGEDGGSFAGEWAAPNLEEGLIREGPLGGTYSSDHRLTGQVTYDGVAFELRGGWRRSGRRGGIAIATIANCN